jgi:hypothetical protein
MNSELEESLEKIYFFEKYAVGREKLLFNLQKLV